MHRGQVPEQVRAPAQHRVADGAAGGALVHADVLPQRAARVERLAAERALVPPGRVRRRRRRGGLMQSRRRPEGRAKGRARRQKVCNTTER